MISANKYTMLEKHKLNLDYIKIFKKILFNSLSFIISFALTFSIFTTKSVNASVSINDRLVEKIAKDYTNKFCNSIAFGLSKESSMKFATKENNMIFNKKKGFESIDKDLVANAVSIAVVERCGYLIELKGNEGIDQFKNDYIAMNSSFRE
mgnify:CR=1 FL=1